MFKEYGGPKMKRITKLSISILTFICLSACNGVASHSGAQPSIESSEPIVKTYTVSFNSNGGSQVSSQEVEEGKKVSKPTDPTRKGYEFVNWTYQGEEWSFIGYVVSEDMVLEANWKPNQYELTLINSDSKKGNISGGGTYAYDSELTINATPNEGYSFIGWYDKDNNLISSDKYYSFIFNTLDYSLIARWNEGNEYTIYLDTNGDHISDTLMNVQYGHSYSLPEPTRNGYTFDGWYDGFTKIDFNGTWNYAVDKIFIAKWSIITYAITYELNGGANNTNNPSSYTVEDDFTLEDPICQFKTFDSWNLNGKRITHIQIGTTGDLIIEAKWSQTTKQKTDEDVAHGVIPKLSEDGKTIVYGLYPQKNVNDSTLVSALNSLTTPESNDWYLYNNEYYAKVVAKPFTIYYDVSFDNGATIKNGTTYWFKCEPITWNVLSNNNGEYYILSSVVLDSHRYNKYWLGKDTNGRYSNNYEYSEIRTWLNNDFYNSAFALGNDCIQTTIVDNSYSTTERSGNIVYSDFACNDTQDKVFLPSYKDYINSSYGFSTSTALADTRTCKITDWAKARGSGYNNGTNDSNARLIYWTRSYDKSDNANAWCVSGEHGWLADINVSSSSLSVRPSLSIKII